MEADDFSRGYVGKLEQRFADCLADIAIDRNRRQSLSTLRQTSLVILGDIDTCFTKQRTDAADHSRNIVVRKNQESIAWLDIHVKRADPREPWCCTALRSPGDCYLLHSPAQSDFHRIRIVLRTGFRCREIDSAILGDRPSIDQIEPFLLHGPLEQTSRSRRKERALCRRQRGT